MYAGESRRAPLAFPAAALLKVYLLGRFEVLREEGPVPADAWRRRRPADLLKLLATAPGRSLPRDGVIHALWPDKGGPGGANNLHRALYDLRQIVGGRWVDLDHGHVSLSPDVWVDVDAFELSAASTDPAERAEAAALYRGDLCPDDLDAPWLAERRQQLRDLMAATALPLARAAAERDDDRTAIPLLRQVLAISPGMEEAHALLMRLLAQAGRRVDALRQYEACEAALRSKGNVVPGAAIRELRDEIRGGRLGPQRITAVDGYRRAARRLLGTSDPPPLRGRDGSLPLLRSLVERGWGTVVLLGERGVGTSRLALEGARMAQEAGAVVLTGTCDGARGGPWSCFADLFEEHARAGGVIDDPFADGHHGAASGRDPTARLLEEVRARLASLGGGAPVYALLEDLHGVDESSVHLFHFLARSARETGLMLVATCREDALHGGTPAHMLLAHLDCQRLARGVRLPRLDLAASRAQLTDVLGMDPGEILALRLYRLTDGSPFYLEELARAFKESGHVQVPEDPVAAVRERVARLGRRAVALLEAGAVMGRRFSLDAVLSATGLSAHDSLLALDEVREARIVDDDGAGQRFHHSLVRDALYEGLAPERRAALHRALADALEERAARAPRGIEGAAEELAHHRSAAGQPERAFGHLVTAGHQASARGGLREACTFYESALALADASGASGPQRQELLDGLGRSQLALADLDGAQRSWGASLALADPSGWRPGPELRARARRQSALALLVAGRAAEARDQLAKGLSDALLGTGEERDELLRLRMLLDWHEGRTTDVPTVAAWAEGPSGAFELALWQNELVGDRPIASLASRAAALRAARADECDWPLGRAIGCAVEGALAARAARHDAAELLLHDARSTFRDQGCAFGEAFTAATLATALTSRGRIDEALAEIGEGLLVAERAQLRRHALLGVYAALARNRLAAGAVDAAEDAVVEAAMVAAKHGDCVVCHALWTPEAIRVHLARGQLDEARAEAEDLHELATRRGMPRLRALASVARGRVLLATGEHEDAAARLLEAVASWDALGELVEAARAGSLAARALEAGGVPERQADAVALAARAAEVLGPTANRDA